MTPKEKAKELFDKYLEVALLYSYEAKLCALIAVDELIKSTPTFDNKNFFDEGASEYWEEVKKEIEAL